MSFPKAFLDELKARVRVSEVVGRKVKLTRKGREYVGLSPFTNEKSPSFTVNDDKQFYHCFSSGEHGDVIKFLEKTENLSFMEAIERLAAEAGLDVPKQDRFVAEREKAAASLIDVMEMAAAFFREKLRSSAGAEARAYIAKRGLTARTVEEFGLGYAPGSRHELMGFLTSKGVPVTDMADAGLIISGEDIPEPYDRFRNRIMFPIADARGRTIAFGGRAMEAGAPAKYLNSPDTPLFHKGRVLYNFHRARKPAHDRNAVIAVEGYMDVIALAQGGIGHAVAPLGTALTEEQIGLLWRMVPEPILCFDGDKAGLKAAYRAVDRVLPLLKPGHSLRFALLPEGQDPDDLIRAQGAEAVEEVLGKARPLSDMLWAKELQAGPLDTPERRADFEMRTETALRAIADPKVRSHYERDFAERLSKLFAGTGRPVAGGGGRSGASPFGRGGRSSFGRKRSSWKGFGGNFDGFIPPATMELRESPLARDAQAAVKRRENLLVLMILNHPALLDRYLEDFAHLDLAIPGLDRLRNEIIDVATRIAPLDRDGLRAHLETGAAAAIVRRLEADAGLRNETSTWREATPDEAESGWLHVLSRHREVVALEAELKAAERALAMETNEENWARLKALNAHRESLDRVDGLDDLAAGPARAFHSDA
ncbi:MAG: DNA primase [Parvibaculaceae bacterium]|nr:DNA primase [Parvibaculaceae bacterium]